MKPSEQQNTAKTTKSSDTARTAERAADLQARKRSADFKTSEKSNKYFARAQKILPGGVNSPVRAFRAVHSTPFFVKKGEGDRIFDVDGNVYTDYVMSWGPLLLGHARKEIVRAVKSAARDGLTFGAPTGRETLLAEEIRRACPHMEMVRLVNSGTEATMSAIRLARGFTGRDKILKFAGCYHGHSDGLLVRAGSGCLTGARPDSLGVPKGYAENTLIAQYNDAENVQKLFAANRGEIACVIVEPVAANMGVVLPRDNFLQTLRKICDKEGALLIFDEVITGFRLAYGGAAQVFGVRPDLAAYGKIVGGGMPLAAYGGRADILSMVAPLGGVYQAGTLSGNPIATAAGLVCLKILRKEKTEIYPAVEESAAMLERAYREAGVPVNRIGSILTPFFAEKAPENYTEVLACDTEKFSLYFREMLRRRQFVAPSQFEAMFVSNAHTREHIEETCEAIALSCTAAKARQE